MRARIAMLALAALTVGCRGDSTSPSSTTETATTTASAATTSDSFSGIVDVGSAIAFTFEVGAYGSVTATLTGVFGAGVPETVQLRVGLGEVVDQECVPTVTSVIRSGETSATATLDAGTRCVRVSDVGNLFHAAEVSLSVAHP